MKEKRYSLRYDPQAESWMLCDRWKKASEEVVAQFYDGDKLETPLGKLLLSGVDQKKGKDLGIALTLILWGLLFLGIPSLFGQSGFFQTLCFISACLCLFMGILGGCQELFSCPPSN